MVDTSGNVYILPVRYNCMPRSASNRCRHSNLRAASPREQSQRQTSHEHLSTLVTILACIVLDPTRNVLTYREVASGYVNLLEHAWKIGDDILMIDDCEVLGDFTVYV
jgi:hypothetical protein